MANFDYTRYAHSQGFYALRGKGKEFRDLAEQLFYIDGAIRYQSLLEIDLRSERFEESELLKSYHRKRDEIFEKLAKVCKPREDIAAV